MSGGPGVQRDESSAKGGAPLRERVASIAARHAERPGPLLEILHAVQQEFGWVPPEAVPAIAKVLNLSRAEVHGVLSFYHHFRHKPPAPHVLQLCRAEACQSMGARSLEARAQAHARAQAGALAVEPVYCLGLCALAPAAMLDGAVQGRLTAERLDAWIDALSPSDASPGTSR